jgi:hypothetical protein
MTSPNKEFLVKVKDSSGTLLANLNKDLVTSSPSISSQINNGYGDVTLDVATRFDDIDSYLAEGNIVEVYAVDSNHPLGSLVHKGVITQVTPYVASNIEGVRLNVLGFTTLLNRVFYRDGSTYTISHAAVDPKVIFEDIIDKFQVIYGSGFVSYTGSSIATVGTSVTKDFENIKSFDALNQAFELVEGGYIWFIDQSGIVYLKEIPSTPTHIFTIGKDVDNLEIVRTAETMINRQRVTYDVGTITVTDSGSITANGEFEGQPVSDTSLNLVSATEVATARVLNNKELKITGRITVTPDFDIELIQIGDTCKVRNYNSSTGFALDNQLIVSKSYNWEGGVTLELGEVRNNITTLLKNAFAPNT